MPAKKKTSRVKSKKKTIPVPKVIPEELEVPTPQVPQVPIGVEELNPREKYMTIGEHLEEFRQILIKGLSILGILMIVSLYFGEEIHKIFVKPYKAVLGANATFFQIKLMAPIIIYLKTSFILSLLLTFPLQLYFLWSFIAPAFEERIEKQGRFLILFSTFLFWSGLAICWFFVFENFLNVFMVMFRPPDVDMKLPIDEYYDIFFNLHLVFGLAFQLPIVLILLSMFGILKSSFLINRWREATIILSVFAAVFSPGPEVFSMLMLFIPLLGLFFLSILIMKFLEKKEKEETD
jgi:sec-independent protein translocase protein TatC